MRQARADIFARFVPKTYDDFVAVTKGDHPLNTAYRMVSSYWEMAAGLVKHGSLHLGLFAENCVSCHGEDGRGLTEMGAPDLTDGFWIYGGDSAALFTTIHGGRQGHMPAWENRLSLDDRKILAVYVLGLGGEDDAALD